MKKVVLGLLGTNLDRGPEENRWLRWRPSVSLFQHEELLIDRFELLVQHKYESLAKTVIDDIAGVSPETEVVCHWIEFADPWDMEEVYSKLHDFARNYSFVPDEEEYLIHISTGTHVVQICLFLLTESRDFPGVLIQTRPAKRPSGGVEGAYTIIDLDLSKYDELARRFEQESREDIFYLKSGIDTRSAGFNALIERIERVALRSRHPILFMGPTGAGKSRLARRIFDLKKQRRQIKGAFVEVNCATIRGDGAMSALFGHCRGAFTGASTDRSGLLRGAHEGLLFLDEVGELGPDEQAMLLRAVEEGRFLPVGSDREQNSDFQLICGTNRDLQDAVRKGRFREDLLARINLWTFTLPGLAQRREDIEPNLVWELDRYAEKTGRRITFNKEARTLFMDFALAPQALWRANFRDLNGAVTRMATLAPGGRITVEVVREEIQRLEVSWNRTEREDGLSRLLSPDCLSAMDLFDRLQLSAVVEVCRRSRSLSQAGRTLFGQSRLKRSQLNDADRIRKYLARFGLTWDRLAEAEASSFRLTGSVQP